MKVVLLEPIKRLGKIGDVVEVKNGFGKNFLLPNKKALRATEESLAVFEAKRAELDKKSKQDQKNAEKIVTELSGKSWVLIKQAAIDGRLFGSVTAKEIAKIISADGFEISHSNVILKTPIKNLGVYQVEISPYVDFSAEILINVARSIDEANDAFAMNMKLFQELEGNLVKAIGTMLFNTLTRRRARGSTELATAEQ